MTAKSLIRSHFRKAGKKLIPPKSLKFVRVGGYRFLTKHDAVMFEKYLKPDSRRDKYGLVLRGVHPSRAAEYVWARGETRRFDGGATESDLIRLARTYKGTLEGQFMTAYTGSGKAYGDASFDAVVIKADKETAEALAYRHGADEVRRVGKNKYYLWWD